MRHLTVCLVCSLAVAAFAGQPVNRLSNGGFEEGTGGWTLDPKQKLATEAGTAHTGRACVTGEIAGKDQSLSLIRMVKVAAGNRYRFECWARATNGTRMVLWVTMPGSRQRLSIQAWDGVPAKWKSFSASFTARGSGSLRLQLVGPSSWNNAPAGRLWVDDLALYETAVTPLLSVSKDVGFNDEPALAAAADGSLYVGWISFRDGADSLQVARYQPEGKSLKEAGAWQAVGGKGTYVLGPRLIPAAGHVALVYAAEVDGNWDIYARPCGPEGPIETDRVPTRITTDSAVDVAPAAVCRGPLWVAWESNRNGCRQIFAASAAKGKPPKPEAVSPVGVSSYDPTIAVLDSGEVCVAWHSFRDGNYDVYLRRRAVDGTWKPVRRLTRAPGIDRHARLVARGDDLWLLYENARTEKYNVTRTNFRRIMTAKVTPEGLLAPKGYAKASPLYGARCEAPTAAFDKSGRLWVSFLKPRLPRAGWDAFVTCWNGARWQAPLALSGQKGMDRAPGLAFVGDRAVVAVQLDDLPRTWSEVNRTPKAKSNVHLATVDMATAPKAAAMQLEPLVEPAEPFEAARLRVERGEDQPTPSITVKGKTLKLFYGDLHEHTDVSVCNRLGDQSIDESYQCMRDLARHDFACATDHGYNINPCLWGHLAKLARTNDDPGRFLTFLGEEWTSSFEKYSQKHPYGYYGHRNLIFADPYFPRWWNANNGQTPAQVWEELRKMKANFVHIPHQIADTGNVPTDWDFTDETAQPVAEIFQTRGSYEFQGTLRQAKRSTPKKGYFLQDAWARGIVIGVIASPDHGGGYGKAAVWAPELTREAILDAIRARRCYGTTGAKIELDIRVNGELMGTKVATAASDCQTLPVKIVVRAPMPIKTIEVCRNNQFVYTHTPRDPKAKAADVVFIDRVPLGGRSYYYVRVILTDDEIAWSSPVWFGAE